jgi:hypothetical protein
LAETPVIISAYYFSENTSVLDVMAYCKGIDMLSRFWFSFYEGFDMPSDRKYSKEEEDEILRFVKKEIEKTLKSMEY